MKKFFSRNSHWLALLIIGLSFLSGFINFKYSTPDIIAIVFGGIGLLAVGYLAFYIERLLRKEKND